MSGTTMASSMRARDARCAAWTVSARARAAGWVIGVLERSRRGITQANTSRGPWFHRTRRSGAREGPDARASKGPAKGRPHAQARGPRRGRPHPQASHPRRASRPPVHAKRAARPRKASHPRRASRPPCTHASHRPRGPAARPRTQASDLPAGARRRGLVAATARSTPNPTPAPAPTPTPAQKSVSWRTSSLGAAPGGGSARRIPMRCLKRSGYGSSRARGRPAARSIRRRSGSAT